MRHSRFFSLLTAALLLTVCVSFTGCSDGSDSSDGGSSRAAGAVTITDMIGRETGIVPGTYERVLCIGAGALRIYSYIGDISLLCGVEDIDNLSLSERPKMFDGVARPYVIAHGEELKALPSCGTGGPNAQTAEAERILSCAPDIVISAYEDADKENALQEQLGVPVVTVRTGVDGVFDEAFAGSLRLLGEIFGRSGKAEALISFVEGQTAEIARRTADIPDDEKPRAYICGLGNWGTTNHLFTSQNYRAFELANIKNAVTGLDIKGVGAIDEEKFTALGADADIMIIDAAAVKNIAPLYAADNTMFDHCAAWKNGEVYLQMAYNAYYTNFELALANAWFAAKCVYPERFEDIDMTAKTDEITTAFLGKPLAAEIFACPSSFGGYRRIDVGTFFG